MAAFGAPLALGGCGNGDDAAATVVAGAIEFEPADRSGPPDLAALTRAEDLLVDLASVLGGLGDRLRDMDFLREGVVMAADAAFAPVVVYAMDAAGHEGGTAPDSGHETDGVCSIPGVAIDAVIAPPPDSGRTPVPDYWRRLQDEVWYFEHAKFYFVRGEMRRTRSGDEVLVTETGFDALARMKSGDWRAMHAEQELTWVPGPGGGEEESGVPDWKIAEWRQHPIVYSEAPRRFFREVLEEALPKPEDYLRARYSHHERNIVDLFTKGSFNVTKQVYADHLDLDSTYQHPALSVVDIDRDGWDDLYVMGRWGRNQLLRNRGDGTFEDVAGRLGLDIDGLCNGAIFADFDNDGDADVIVARSLERSVYLRNEDGRYVDRTSEAFGPMPLPYLVSSASAVDFNLDGLLDIYLALYGPTHLGDSVEKWAFTFFPKPLAEELIRRQKAESHRYINLIGPPNLLLVNRGGGRFEVAPEAQDLAEWHNTHQASWADFDQDGDPDVYVCNDFGPDHLYRNDEGPAPGVRRFTEISHEMAGDAMQGFGMGVTWGDYDRDERLDLYVTNMFSKAGRRITRAIPGLDPRIPWSAEGNLLFRNTGDRFDQVAGLEAPAMKVAKVGWAYGAQFVDVDNDGWLDIYSASGFYTAPEEIRTERDL